MSVTTVRHNKIDLALHQLRAAIDETARPLLLLHGLGEHTPAEAPAWVTSWQGAIVGLDFTGHGNSTIPSGGGYTAELLLGDADAALAALVEQSPDGMITVFGRGLGAYIGLQLAGARASQVHGAIMLDGPGLAGGPTGPTSQSFFSLPPSNTTPDPYALVELGRDLRPPDYVRSFVQLAIAGSKLEEPVAVCTVFRPEWLAAVADEHGVMDVPLAEALETFA
ncbi:serine aminopeptidase domain-containing protein [Ilumatobacter sp.]|uniref:serine aminopeptidase domain-containing protein n=1 Tax=Ilumatobacter sp. TaxID=1967498 RepID=UPI0030A9CE35